MRILKSIVALGLMFSLSARAVAAMPARIMNPQSFCSNVKKHLASLSESQGEDHDAAQRYGEKATQLLIDHLRRGQIDPYINISALSQAHGGMPEASWIPTPDLLIMSFGMRPQNAIWVEHLDELRMVSHIMPRSDVLIMASQHTDFSAEKSLLVSKTAKALGVRINIILSGDRRHVSESGRKVIKDRLATLSTTTGGVLLDLANTDSCVD